MPGLESNYTGHGLQAQEPKPIRELPMIVSLLVGTGHYQSLFLNP